MLVITIFMVLAVLAAALVIVYVAYPHRGEDVPHVPELGKLMTRTVERLPRVEEGEMDTKAAPWERPKS